MPDPVARFMVFAGRLQYTIAGLGEAEAVVRLLGIGLTARRARFERLKEGRRLPEDLATPEDDA